MIRPLHSVGKIGDWNAKSDPIASWAGRFSVLSICRIGKSRCVNTEVRLLSRRREYQLKEEFVRRDLSKKYGVKLEKRKLRLRNTDREHEFDIVSPDETIVGEVKSYKLLSSGNRPSAKIAHIAEACLFLLHAEKAKKRLLVFTDKEFFEYVKRGTICKIAKANGIDVMFCDTKRMLKENE